MNPAGAAQLCDSIRRIGAQLMTIPDEQAAERPGEGKWSKKEILGHLIDSASNNHQRFVRLLLQKELSLPGYEQEEWVRAQAYHERPWGDLVALWAGYNLHLAQLIADVPPEALEHECRIGDAEPKNLAQLMEEYLRHLLHHIGQIFPADERAE